MGVCVLLFSLHWLSQEVDQLGRLIDEIPTRAELLQYERRFTELYDQVCVFFVFLKSCGAWVLGDDMCLCCDGMHACFFVNMCGLTP